MFFWDAFFMKRLTFIKKNFLLFLFFLIIFCSSALSAPLLDNIIASAL